jgi:hypothetical protein
VTLIGASGFVGNVYAPNARITAVGDGEVYGSLLRGSPRVHRRHVRRLHDRRRLLRPAGVQPSTGTCGSLLI